MPGQIQPLTGRIPLPIVASSSTIVRCRRIRGASGKSRLGCRHGTMRARHGWMAIVRVSIGDGVRDKIGVRGRVRDRVSLRV